MQQNYAESLLRSGIIEAKAGSRQAARRYLERAVYSSSNLQHDTMAEAWFWLAQVSDDPQEKRQALENALSHDLRHQRARRELAILEGKIKPEELVDPDRLIAAEEEIHAAEAERFMCPKCGGRMSFSADGQSLVCDYCTRRENVQAMPGRIDEEDFLVAMHTRRGHSSPLSHQIFQCGGCGAEFILPPTLISASCVYCGSPHVISLEKSEGLIAPEALLPHAFERKEAQALLAEWAAKHNLQCGPGENPPIGLYLPIWFFRFGGRIDITGHKVVHDEAFGGETHKLAIVQDHHPVQLEQVPVPATRKFARPLSQLLNTFDFSALKAYEARYLADWPAEVYDVSVGDASLDARSHAYQQMKQKLSARLNSIQIVTTSSAGMTVESFKLVLLPVWIGSVSRPGPDLSVLINGQNGCIADETSEKKGLLGWLADVLDG